MATLLNKMVSWAAREAEELASRSGMSLERAAEEVADKYGQKAFSATTKPTVEEFATSTPSMFLGDVNAPSNKSLRELVSPGVEQSITAREASKYSEPFPLNRPASRAGESAMLGVQESTVARDASKYREPGVAGQKQIQNLQESTVARDASRYNEPTVRPRPEKSETSASEDFESSLGELDTGIYPSEISRTARRGLAGALGGAGIVAAGAAGYDRAKEISAPEGQGPVADSDKYLQSLSKLPTPEVKKEAKKAVTATDTTAKEAQKAADKGEIPQVEADRFKEERDRAYKMYSEAKDRNEWLELAQLLGQAVTQYGAAQVGMRTGRSMAGLQIPSVDYGTRTAQEQRLLETRLRDIGEEQTREQRLADRLKEDRREEDRLALERRRVELAEREARAPKESSEAREIKKEERKKQEQKQVAITNIMAGLATLKVGNKKQREAASELIDKNIAEARLPSEAINKLSELKEGPGFFGGNWDKTRQEVESLLQPSAPSATILSQPVSSLSTEDQQALEWATQNPNDPRAAEIRKRLGR